MCLSESGPYVVAYMLTQKKSTFSVRHIEGPVQDVLKRLLRKSCEKTHNTERSDAIWSCYPLYFFVNQLSQVLHRNDSSRRLVNSVNILAKPIAF